MRFFDRVKKIKISRHKKTMIFAVLTMVSLLSVMSVGPIYAYLKMTGAGVTNTFNAAQPATPYITESFDGTTKSNVCVNVGDTGGYSVYVRATIVAVWKNADEDVLAAAPAYTLSIGDDWRLIGDYYYYNTPVESGHPTTTLIESCSPTGPAPEEGYFLSVEVLAQTIQAVGTTDSGDVAAVTDAWGVTL
jgi:hypothetical protein